VARGELALLQKLAHRVGQVQEPGGVGNGGAGLAHPLGHLLLGHAVLVHEDLVAVGLFDGVQILPLEVLDEAQLHDLLVVGLDDHSRDLGKARQLGGPPAPLAGDDLVIAGGQPPDGEGLNDPVGADGVGQVGQSFLVETLPGLVQPRLDLRDGEGEGTLTLVLKGGVAQQGAQALAQAVFHCHIHSFFLWGRGQASTLSM